MQSFRAHLLFFAMSLASIATNAQVWQMQDSGTTAGLRGIDSVDGKVAWASGTGGTVLKTIDGGAHWTQCAVPEADKDGATLDFRGVQAWDATTAIVMASGPGDKSRLYKTSDGCGTWKLLFRNTEKEGFWDAIRITGQNTGLLIGDPIPKKEFERFKVKTFFIFPLYGTVDRGKTWKRLDGNILFAFSIGSAGKPTESIFAASNSSLLETANHRWIFYVLGGNKAFLEMLEFVDKASPLICKSPCTMTGGAKLPLSAGQTAGGFSIAVRDGDTAAPKLVVVGGDYSKPAEQAGTAAVCFRVESDPPFLTSFNCEASTEFPHGYRSAVEWSGSIKAWITVGTNGSDISRDDGKTWQPLDDGNWNALSLPFVVGPNGRIAKLHAAALPASKP